MSIADMLCARHRHRGFLIVMSAMTETLRGKGFYSLQIDKVKTQTPYNFPKVELESWGSFHSLLAQKAMP